MIICFFLLQSFIAIDDISFTSACKHSKKPHSNGTTPNSKCLIDNQFTCLDGSCISDDEVCDFYPTCPQGEDEWDCSTFCDFDHTSTSDELCNWTTDKDDPNPKMIRISRENANSASGLSQYYPPTDNTLRNETGYFMFIYPLDFNDEVEPKLELNIISTEYGSSSSLCMFSLDYYIAIDSKCGY